MSKQFDGVPKGAPFYNSGAGPLDEKSWVEHIEDFKNLDESKYKDKQKVYCFEDQNDYQLNKSATPTAELGRWEKKETSNVIDADIQVGDTTQTITIPKNKKYVSSYCIDENNDIVVVSTKVIGATATSEGSVTFTLVSAVDHNIKCVVVYI
ncbi:MAG: hypothetical protein MJ151_01785 [Lachnospiraceae bacterium]|nr:hypothetical protein [Lachnospiraceae bacterium]